MNETLTFENLPTAVNQLSAKLEKIEKLLLLKSEQQPTKQTDQLLTIEEAANLLHLTKPTLYSKVSKGELPGVCKQGKRLYFSKESLIDWIKSSKRKSNQEIEAEAETYLLNKKKGLNNGR